MKERLHFEWKLSTVVNGENFLFENHDIPNEVEAVIREITPTVRQTIMEYNRALRPFYKVICKDVNSAFVKTLIVNLTILPDESLKKCDCEGNFTKRGSLYSGEEGKYEYLTINCVCHTPLRGIGVDDVLPAIAHELLHSYENVKRLQNNADDLFTNVAKRGYNHMKIDGEEKSYLETNVKELLYLTTDSERNAFVTTVITELKPYLSDCENSKDAYSALSEESDTWNHILLWENWLQWFVKQRFTNDDEKIVLDLWNRVTKQNVTDYNVFLKRLTKRWNIFKKKLISSLGKQIADAAFENPNWFYLKPKSRLYPIFPEGVNY